MGNRKRAQINLRQVNGTGAVRALSLRWAGACGIAVVLITLMLYVPALKNDFVNFDDNEYVYENTYIRSINLHTLSWMLTEFHAANWHPLSWLSHAADYCFWGPNPFGHHLTSIILHGLNTLLVFLLVIQLMLRAEGIPAAFSPSRSVPPCTVRSLVAASVASLLFGIHPLHVESVAWVAERKDVLCAFFLLLTLCCYLLYASSVEKKYRRVWFAACMALAIAALMAKPMAVTLPLILLLLDMYPLQRIAFSNGAEGNLRVVLEKVPFCIVSFISAILTVLAQQAVMAFKSLESLSLELRIANAFHAPLFYLAKMIWPVRLVPFYPFPKEFSSLDNAYYGISGVLFLLVTGVCIWLWRRGHYLFFTAWAYYLITLLPVAGIVQVGSQAAADRYTYLPSVSIFILAGIGVAEMLAGTGLRKNVMRMGAVIIALIFIIFGQLTVKQMRIWRDSETLWNHVIRNFPGRVHFAHNNLGAAYVKKGLFDEAFEEYKKAIAISPTYAEAHTNLGNAYTRRGEYDKAIAEHENALAANPRLMSAYYNLGNSYYAMGMYDDAIVHYKKFLAADPNNAEAYNNLGNAYYKIDNYSDAAAHFDKALALGYKVNLELLEFVKHSQPYF
jgi:tetratricopeptide (TPR) repeat protein